jgi:hypothetical protein
MNARHVVTASLAIFCWAGFGFSATLDRVDISESEGRYQLVADSWLDAPPAAISAVLLNFKDDAYLQISEIYKESGVLDPDVDGTPLVYTRVEGCVMLFCRSMSRVERLEVVSPTFIRSTAVPERSDFLYAISEWTLAAEGEGTRIHYRMALEPDFWLPPFVGPALLRRILLRGGVEAVERIEELAQEQELAAKQGGPARVQTVSLPSVLR